MEEVIYKHYHPACKTTFDPVTGNSHILISSMEELEAVLNNSGNEIAWDTETNSLSPTDGDIVGFSFSFDGKTGYYVPVKHLIGNNLPMDALTVFYNKLTSCEITYVFNMRFDFRFLEKYGFDMYKVPYIDIAVGCWLSDTNVKMPSLKKSEKHFLGWTPPTYEDTISKGLTFDYLDPKDAYVYACIDAEGTFALKDIANYYMAEGRSKEQLKTQKYSNAAILENRSLYPLMKYEEETIKVDIPFLKDYVQKLYAEIEDIEKNIYAIAGKEFNLNSNIQLGNVLKEMGINTGVTTNSGNMKVDINTLTALYHKSNNKILDMIVRHSQLVKVVNSYYQVLINEAERMGGVARFSYLTNNVPTGRLACLPKTELIKTDSGYKQLKDLDSNIDKVDVGVGEFASFSIIPTGIKELTKYTFSNGKSLVMSENHRLLTKTSKDCDYKWKHAKDLKKGDLICTPLKPHQLFKINADGFYKGYVTQVDLYEAHTVSKHKVSSEAEDFVYKRERHSLHNTSCLLYTSSPYDRLMFLKKEIKRAEIKNAEPEEGNENKLAFWESYIIGMYYATPSDKLITFDDNSLSIVKKVLNLLKWSYTVERALYKGKLVYKVCLDNIDMQQYTCKLPKLIGRYLSNLYKAYANAVVNNEYAQVYDYTKLVNIQPIKLSQEVYDLSVEHPLHQYVSNGVISHNCASDKKNSFFTHLNVQSSPKPHSAKWYVHQGFSDNPNDVNIEGWYFSLTEESNMVTDGYINEGNFRNAFMAGDDEYWVSIDFCLDPTLIIETDKGTLTLGDLINYKDIKVKTPKGYKRAFNFHYTGLRQLCKLRLSDGHELRCSPNHKIRIKRDSRELWMEFEKLSYTDKIVTSHGLQSIISLECTEEQIDMCDITVEDCHCFYANGVLVHNCAQELRILSNLSKEPNWVNTFLSGGDLHAAQAKAMWGEENYSPDKRKMAKVINFGLAYGMSAYSLAEKFEISLQEAQDTIDKYWKAAPEIHKFQKSLIQEATETGTVYNAFGLPRRVGFYLTTEGKESFGRRTVCNTAIQSVGACVLKFVFIKLWVALFSKDEYKDIVRFQTTVHDEINYVVKKEHIKSILDKITDCMRVDLDIWKVPLEVEVELGDRWGRCFAFDPRTLIPKFEVVKK